MPEFTYAGQVPRHYPELRDEHGQIVGAAGHGDTRDLAGAPDEMWLEGAPRIAPAWPGVSAGMYRAQPDGGEGDDGSENEHESEHETAPPPPPDLTPPATQTPAADGQKDG